jgi:hypothetical protein
MWYIRTEMIGEDKGCGIEIFGEDKGERYLRRQIGNPMRVLPQGNRLIIFMVKETM